MLITLIEEYNSKLLSTKVYWDKLSKREEFKAFWDKYKKISKLKETNYNEYCKQKEILFLKNDLKNIRNSSLDYSQIEKYYKRKLLDYNAIREIKDSCKTLEGRFVKVRGEEVNV